MKDSKLFYALSVALSTSSLLVFPVIILIGIGYLIDSYILSNPFGMIIGGILGFIVGISLVYRLLMTTKLTEGKSSSQKRNN